MSLKATMRHLNYLILSLSMSVSAIASQPIDIESPTSGRKVFRDLKNLEKEAWALAYVDESLRSYRKEELVKRTAGVIDDLYCEMIYNDSSEKRKQARGPFFDVFNIFYGLDSAQALVYLKKRYQESDEQDHRNFRLNVLLSMIGKDEDFYRTESQKTLSEHLDDVIKILIDSPETKQRAEGSLVSLDAVYTRMCQIFSQPSREEEDKEVERAWGAFATFISREELLESYAERLAPKLVTFLSNHRSLCFRYCDLVAKSPAVLRDAAFQALIIYLVNEKPTNRTDFHFTSTADALFKKDSRKFGYILGKPPAFFKTVFEALSAVRADYPIQLMWQTMNLREPDVRQEIVKQVRSYFNLAAKDVDSSVEVERGSGGKRKQPVFDLQEILGQSLVECLTSNSLPHSALHQFCEAAKMTGIYKSLPSEVLVSLGDQVFWNQDALLTQRYEAFNNILRRSVGKAEVAKLKIACQECLPESPLLSYVLLAIQIVEVTPKTSYDMYNLMGKMIELGKAHPEICIPNDFILSKSIRELVLEEGKLSEFTWSPRYFTWLYNMKEYHDIGRHDENAPYVAVDHGLRFLSFDEEGYLYGLLYDCNIQEMEGFNYYRLYKCDPYTGYAKWSMVLSYDTEGADILNSGRPKYTVGSKYVYVMSGDNQVVVFNRTSGEYVRDITISYVDSDVKLSFIGAIGESLFTAGVRESRSQKIDSKVFLKCLPQGNAEGIWPMRLHQTVNRFSTNGEYFVCTGYGSSVKHFFNASGKNIAIDGDLSSERSKHAPEATVDGDMLYYTQKQADKSFQLVHMNLVTGDELWRTPLMGNPKQAPVLSIARDCMFMLFDKNLCALSTNPASPGKLLWKVSANKDSFFNKFNHIEASSDGRYVYGLESTIRTVYRYEVKTGAEEGLGELRFGRTADLIGSRADGKVFIKPHVF